MIISDFFQLNSPLPVVVLSLVIISLIFLCLYGWQKTREVNAHKDALRLHYESKRDPLITNIIAAVINISRIQLSEAGEILEPLFKNLFRYNDCGVMINGPRDYASEYEVMINLLSNKLDKSNQIELACQINQTHSIIRDCLMDFTEKKASLVISEIERNLTKLSTKLGELQKLIPV